jgi:Zn finger protein HypA/HybF involved in hydrogenase expression
MTDPITLGRQTLCALQDELASLEERKRAIHREAQAAAFDARTEMTRAERESWAKELYWHWIDIVNTDAIKAILDLGQSAQVYAFVGPAQFTARCVQCNASVTIAVTSRRDYEQRSTPKALSRLLCDQCKQPGLEVVRQSQARMDALAARREELAAMPYQEYLQTEEWQETRKDALRRAKYRCQLCYGEGVLHVHHRTYERRGHELSSDLIVLCESCHRLHHGK